MTTDEEVRKSNFETAHGELRLWLLFMQGGKCLLCGQGFDLSVQTNGYGSATIEHKVAASKAGGFARTNLGLSHYECNKARGSVNRMKLIRPGPKYWRRQRMIELSDLQRVRNECTPGH